MHVRVLRPHEDDGKKKSGYFNDIGKERSKGMEVRETGRSVAGTKGKKKKKKAKGGKGKGGFLFQSHGSIKTQGKGRRASGGRGDVFSHHRSSAQSNKK